MIGRSELRINFAAEAAAASPVRHAIAAFLSAHRIAPEPLENLLTAIGEVLANAVEHAYAGERARDVEVVTRCDEDRERVSVDVYDRGRFVDHAQREGRGLGLVIVRAIARELTISTADGTHVRMSFDAPQRPGR